MRTQPPERPRSQADHTPLPDSEIETNSLKGFFGQVLDSPAPIIICDCIAFLRNRGLYDTGIFRIPGSKEVINGLRSEYNKAYSTKKEKEGSDFSILNEFTPKPTVNDVASLFKLFFKTLKEPLIPEAITEAMMKACKDGNGDKQRIAFGLSRAMERMPSPNKECLAYLISFLREICCFRKYNKMSAENLATCFVLSVMGHGDKVNQFDVLGRGAVVLRFLVQLPVKLCMPLLEDVKKNTRFDEFLDFDEFEEPGSKVGRFTHSTIGLRKAKAAKKKKPKPELRYTKNGTRILAEKIKIADLIQPSEKQAPSEVDFDISNFISAPEPLTPKPRKSRIRRRGRKAKNKD